MYLYMYSLLLYISALHVTGAIYTHPQERNLQSIDLGVCNFCGMLVYWSRFWLWLGHLHNLSTVKFELDRAKM
jgi:hypothetical protein